MITRGQFGTLAAVEASGEAVVHNEVELERLGIQQWHVHALLRTGLLVIDYVGSLELIKVTTAGRSEMINFLARRQ